MQMSITLLITHAFVNILEVHDTKHFKFKVWKFESHLVFRVKEYIVKEISAFKSQFYHVFVHVEVNKICLEKSGKRSNFALEKSGKPQSDFFMNPLLTVSNMCFHCLSMWFVWT